MSNTVDRALYLDFVSADPAESNLGMRFEIIDDKVVAIGAGLREQTRLGVCS